MCNQFNQWGLLLPKRSAFSIFSKIFLSPLYSFLVLSPYWPLYSPSFLSYVPLPKAGGSSAHRRRLCAPKEVLRTEGSSALCTKERRLLLLLCSSVEQSAGTDEESNKAIKRKEASTLYSFFICSCALLL